MYEVIGLAIRILCGHPRVSHTSLWYTPLTPQPNRWIRSCRSTRKLGVAQFPPTFYWGWWWWVVFPNGWLLRWQRGVKNIKNFDSSFGTRQSQGKQMKSFIFLLSEVRHFTLHVIFPNDFALFFPPVSPVFSSLPGDFCAFPQLLYSRAYRSLSCRIDTCQNLCLGVWKTTHDWWHCERQFQSACALPSVSCQSCQFY